MGAEAQPLRCRDRGAVMGAEAQPLRRREFLNPPWAKIDEPQLQGREFLVNRKLVAGFDAWRMQMQPATPSESTEAASHTNATPPNTTPPESTEAAAVVGLGSSPLPTKYGKSDLGDLDLGDFDLGSSPLPPLFDGLGDLGDLGDLATKYGKSDLGDLGLGDLGAASPLPSKYGKSGLGDLGAASPLAPLGCVSSSLSPLLAPLGCVGNSLLEAAAAEAVEAEANEAAISFAAGVLAALAMLPEPSAHPPPPPPSHRPPSHHLAALAMLPKPSIAVEAEGEGEVAEAVEAEAAEAEAEAVSEAEAEAEAAAAEVAEEAVAAEVGVEVEVEVEVVLEPQAGAESAAAETATALEEETTAGTTASVSAADEITLVPPEAQDTPSAPDRSQHACAPYGAFALQEVCDTPSAPRSSCSSQQLFLTACETPSVKSASLAHLPLVVRSGDKLAAGSRGRRLQCSLDEVAFSVATEPPDPTPAAPTTAPAAGMSPIDVPADAAPSDFAAGVLAALAQLPAQLPAPLLRHPPPFPDGSCSSARSLNQIETAAVAETVSSDGRSLNQIEIAVAETVSSDGRRCRQTAVAETAVAVAAAQTGGAVGRTLVHRTAASPARQTLHVMAWAGFGAVYTVEVPGMARRLVPAAKGVQDELLRRLWWRRLWDIMCQGSGDIPY